MHELSIALGIVDVAAEELARHGGGSVIAVHVKVGALSGVVSEALQSAFELARQGSQLEQANLLIEPVGVTFFCPQCEREQPANAFPELCCPRCGTYSSEVVKGRELEVVAMEIES